jgi:hypothetical protein
VEVLNIGGCLIGEIARPRGAGGCHDHFPAALATG